jgi:hypothetical protein
LKAGGALRFSILGGTIVVLAGLAVLPVGLARGDLALRWGVVGWAIMAVTGVAGGAWLARMHGRQGSGFLVALGTCMLARLFASVGGALVAALSGKQAVWPYIVGLCVGYVPLQLFEIGWFLRWARIRDRGATGSVGRRSAREVGAGR